MLHKQQLTYSNNKNVENFLHKVLEEVSHIFKDNFSYDQTAALILIGGYGRGEGGVVIENGVASAHNNLDLLYIHNGRVSSKTVSLVNDLLQAISKKYNIGIDMFAINKQKLLNLNGLVIGYDMRHGHKTLLGDSSFLKEHKSFSIYNIDTTDVRQLIVNRGTLLLINRLLLQKESLTKKERKLIIKHAIKAIIGYGDALLYFNNIYHWSYAKKQSNMSESTSIDPKIKTLYSEAILFRFMPNYEEYLLKDLQSWNDELIEIFSSIHLNCETINLNESELNWDKYLCTALEKKSFSRQNLPQKIKSCLYGLKKPSIIKELDNSFQVLSYMQFGAKGILSLLFPYIAYKVYPEKYHNIFKKILSTENINETALLNAFLLLWAKHGDTNFINVLNTHNITLEKS